MKLKKDLKNNLFAKMDVMLHTVKPVFLKQIIIIITKINKKNNKNTKMLNN